MEGTYVTGRYSGWAPTVDDERRHEARDKGPRRLSKGSLGAWEIRSGHAGISGSTGWPPEAQRTVLPDIKTSSRDVALESSPPSHLRVFTIPIPIEPPPQQPTPSQCHSTRSKNSTTTTSPGPRIVAFMVTTLGSTDKAGIGQTWLAQANHTRALMSLGTSTITQTSRARPPPQHHRTQPMGCSLTRVSCTVYPDEPSFECSLFDHRVPFPILPECSCTLFPPTTGRCPLYPVHSPYPCRHFARPDPLVRL